MGLRTCLKISLSLSAWLYKASLLRQNQIFSPFGHCSAICCSHFGFTAFNTRFNFLSFWAFCEVLLADTLICAQGFCINQKPNANQINGENPGNCVSHHGCPALTVFFPLSQLYIIFSFLLQFLL